ncbi:MAG TPA: helix-turn-helix domain-containing protein [Jatrophihabitantaceae bacterium]|nr:helix-turn-helix domain-containing protein [Jatrophihabitantaceae bacterium]
MATRKTAKSKTRVFEMDAPTLKALAHPMRVQMLRILQLRDQASVTSLAEELGETTGATSYHLRQLARHGLVEQCSSPEGESRQKWWRLAVDQIHMAGFEFMANDETREAVGFLLREYSAERSRKLANWYATATQWPEAWQKASSDADGNLDLNPTQLRALADEMAALLTKYRELKPGRGARKVDVQYAVFPSDTGERP